MGKTIFILFGTDTNHTNSSNWFIDAFEIQLGAVNAACDHAKVSKEGGLSSHDMILLKDINQTQNRSENYIIVETELK